jgi:hypothetical protein
MRAGAGAVGGPKIEVVELSLKKAGNGRFYRVGVEQDGDAEPFLKRRQFGGKLAMVGVPVGVEAMSVT